MVTATKWISVMALLLAMYGFRSANYFTVVAAFVVCAGAVVVLRQAFGKGQYLWAGAFMLIAVLVNPFVPFSFSHSVLLVFEAASMIVFLMSLWALKSTPRLSIASIADPDLRNEAL
jgi:hypothetical protein